MEHERKSGVLSFGIVILFFTVALIFVINMFLGVNKESQERTKQKEADGVRDEIIYNYYDNKGIVVDDVVERKNGTLLVNFKDGDYKVVKVKDGEIKEILGRVNLGVNEGSRNDK